MGGARPELEDKLTTGMFEWIGQSNDIALLQTIRQSKKNALFCYIYISAINSTNRCVIQLTEYIKKIVENSYAE